MRSMLTGGFTALCLLLAWPWGIEAQASAAVEIRGSLNYPVGDFANHSGVNARSEAGFGADFIVPAWPRVSLYVGAGREMFGCADCEGDDGFTTTGFEAGAKLLFAREGTVLPWIKAGAIYHEGRIDLGGSKGESDWGFGFQGAAGADIPLGEVLSFSPAIRYQTYTAKFPPFGLDLFRLRQPVSFFSLDLGLHIHFLTP